MMKVTCANCGKIYNIDANQAPDNWTCSAKCTDELDKKMSVQKNPTSQINVKTNEIDKLKQAIMGTPKTEPIPEPIKVPDPKEDILLDAQELALLINLLNAVQFIKNTDFAGIHRKIYLNYLELEKENKK